MVVLLLRLPGRCVRCCRSRCELRAAGRRGILTPLPVLLLVVVLLLHSCWCFWCCCGRCYIVALPAAS